MNWASLVAHASLCRRPGFDPWVGKIPWRRDWQPTPVFLLREPHGHMSQVEYSPCGHQELDMIEWLTLSLSTSHGVLSLMLGWRSWTFCPVDQLLWLKIAQNPVLQDSLQRTCKGLTAEDCLIFSSPETGEQVLYVWRRTRQPSAQCREACPRPSINHVNCLYFNSKGKIQVEIMLVI